jgi:hypothetical protein
MLKRKCSGDMFFFSNHPARRIFATKVIAHIFAQEENVTYESLSMCHDGIRMVCGMIDNIYSARAGDGSNGKEKQADYGRRHKEAVVRGPMDSASGSSTPTCTGGDDDSRSRSGSDGTNGDDRNGMERNVSAPNDALHLERRVR